MEDFKPHPIFEWENKKWYEKNRVLKTALLHQILTLSLSSQLTHTKQICQPPPRLYTKTVHEDCTANQKMLFSIKPIQLGPTQECDNEV
eukprot:SAG11_NODE_391_length_9839_cov_4.875257_9_plen_89_part_00